MKSPASVFKDASGIFPTDNNPEYTSVEFYKLYPQFQEHIPGDVLNMFILLANSTLSEEQWNEAWQLGMGLFIAHFLVMWLKTSAVVETDEEGKIIPTRIEKVISLGAPKGLLKEKAANTLKTVYDNGLTLKGLENGGSFMLTTYGQQYLTLARMMATGMVV